MEWPREQNTYSSRAQSGHSQEQNGRMEEYSSSDMHRC